MRRAGTAMHTDSNAVGSSGRARARGAGLRGVALLLVLLGVLGGTHAARAQTTTSTSLTPLSSPSGSISLIPNANGIDRVRPYSARLRPWWISYADCLANDVFTFTLTVRDTSDPLEIWAGTENCATNRSRTDRGQCWIVARESQLSDSVEVEVPVRNILARRLNVTDPPIGVSDDVCDDSTDPSGEAISFYFMLVDGGQADEYFSWDGGTGGTGFDVVGPDPPGNISVGIGESQLAIRIRDVREETDRQRFEAFCVPEGTMRASLGIDAGAGVSGEGVSGDAGASLDAGSSNGGIDAGQSGAAPAECFTDLLVTGQRPPAGFSCGTAGETSRTLSTSRLANGITYAVAIAGQDDLGNAGVASEIQCGTPILLDDFFETYARAGGPGGGGFCSLPAGASGGAGSGARAGAGLLLLLAGFGLRRRRSRA